MTTADGCHARWERDTRYYELRLERDLLGDWVLVRVWGRRGSAMGQVRKAVCGSREEGLALFADAEGRRRKRGYVRVGCR